LKLLSFIGLTGFTVSLLASACWVPLAQASYICPNGPAPGDVQIGVTPGGNGVAPLPICQETYQPSESIPNSEPSVPLVDPMQSRVNTAISTLKLLELQLRERQKLAKDPKYQAFLKGAWEFFPGNNDAAPGESCAALFWKKDGLIMLSGPGKDYRGALLTFWGKDIPRPNKVERVKVTLTQQSNEPPQTVQAFNYATPGIEYGAITFAVPTIEAALATMEDVLSFDLAIEGKSVAKIQWHSGLAARDKLRECVSARTSK
jgi:hypothetical protein